MFTLAQLRTFSVVARLNSFSRAAEQLHLTQPAVSAQIVALEEALGARLFDRIGKKIALSDAGHIVLRTAEELLDKVVAMQRQLADLSGLKTGRLSIGASQVPGVYLLPDLLARFRTEYQGVELSARVETAREVIDMLLRGEVDIGLVGEGAPVDHERIGVKPVFRDELVLIVPPHHLFSQMKSVPPASLRHMPFVLPSRHSASSENTLDQLARDGIKPETVLELGNIGAVKRAVQAGLGISIVSRMAVAQELADGRLVSVPLAGKRLARQISLAWNHGKPFSKATEAFIGFVNRHAPTSPWALSAEST